MITFIKRNKLLSLFILGTVIAFIFGVLFYAFIDADNKNLISNNINLLFNNELIDFKSLFFNNLFSCVLIWVLGISIIGFILIILLYLFKTFIFSFEIISLIANINRKNIFMVLGYVFPNFFSIALFFILSFYSVSYSIFLIKYIFRGHNGNIHIITKKYLKILVGSFVLTLVCCILEYFILKNISILKF